MDFLVIGAQKAATSWLYECLNEHPEIQLPPGKREVEYLGGNLSQLYGTEWYFGLVDRQQHATFGDVSVEYLFDARCPAEVFGHLPRVKLIVLLREPISRAISAYAWIRRSPADTTDLPPTAEQTFELLIQKGYSIYPAHKANYCEILTRGFYDVQISRYLDYFDPSAFLVLTYDQISQSPQDAVKRVFQFVEVDEEFEPESLHNRPKETDYMFPGLMRTKSTPFVKKVGERVVQELVKFTRQQRLHKALRLTNEMERRLKTLYAPHIDELDNLLEIFPETQKPSTKLVDKWGYKNYM